MMSRRVSSCEDPVDELIHSIGPEEFVGAVEKELRELATESPAFSYSGGAGVTATCFYHRGVTAEDDPAGSSCSGCIFGQAFQRLGLQQEDCEFYGGIGSIVIGCPNRWTDLQRLQDGGTPWGEAIKELDK